MVAMLGLVFTAAALVASEPPPKCVAGACYPAARLREMPSPLVSKAYAVDVCAERDHPARCIRRERARLRHVRRLMRAGCDRADAERLSLEAEERRAVRD